MAQTTLSIRIDSSDKQSFENFCAATGMNISVAITMFVKTVLREQKLPFEIKIDPFYSIQNQQRLANAVTDLNNEKGKPHELDELTNA